MYKTVPFSPTCFSFSLKFLRWAEEGEVKFSIFTLPARWEIKYLILIMQERKWVNWQNSSTLEVGFNNVKMKKAHLQGFCTAGSPSWCGQWIHTGSSNAFPVHLFSSSARACVSSDPCCCPPHPFCLSGVLVFSQHPFCAWTWTRIVRNTIQTSSFTHKHSTDKFRRVLIVPTSYAWGSLSWSGRSCHRCGSSDHWEPPLPRWELQDQRNTPGGDIRTNYTSKPLQMCYYSA